MRSNISALETYLECPRKWYYTYILKKGIPHHGGCTCGMCEGTRWHQLVSGEKTLDDFPSPPPWMVNGFKAWEAWQRLHNKDISFLAKELTLEAELAHHTIFGRLDALVDWNDKLWHLQHKTLRGSVPWDVYTRVIRRSFHEHAYQHLITTGAYIGVDPGKLAFLRDYLEQPYGGTILVTCRKVNTAFPILTEYLQVGNHGQALEDIDDILSAMEWSEAHGIYPENRKSCAGMFQNKLCPFIDVCDRKQPLSEMPDLDPLEAYK